MLAELGGALDTRAAHQCRVWREGMPLWHEERPVEAGLDRIASEVPLARKLRVVAAALAQ